jgi:cytochrome c-type biogenesis protein CcmI
VILFWVICALLILVALAFILPTAFQDSADKESESDARRQANINVYRDQLSELESD